jgi:hypothetical protein
MGSRFAIAYEARPAVRAAIERIQRAEDVRFSPDNRRLAIADFDGEAIAVADLEITSADENSPRVAVTNVTEIRSGRLCSPHGVSFLDDETIIAASREGTVTVHRVPRDDAGDGPVEPTSVDVTTTGFGPVLGPSAISVAIDEAGDAEVLVCNFYGDTVTRHVVRRHGAARCEVTMNDVLLCNHLGRPDGVAVSPDGAWIALSILDPPRLLLYERRALHEKSSDPHAVLRGVWHPHGVRFSPDSRSLLVADAATPSVHVYARNGATWRGVQLQPVASLDVIDDALFERERAPGRRGPKGIDLDRSGRVLAVTCEYQPLAFFDVSAVLDRNAGGVADPARLVSYELSIMHEERAIDARYQARIASILGSRSYRLTKPLRSLNDVVKRRRSR